MTQTSEHERLWLVTLACGHQHQVWTFIGDFDYAKHHEGLGEICHECRDAGKEFVVDLVSAVLLDPNELENAT